MRTQRQGRRTGLPLALILALAGPHAAAGQGGVEAGDPIVESVGTREMLSLKLSTSRPQLTAGSVSSITGILTNVSADSVVYLAENSVSLMQPPELRGPRGELESWWAFFASEPQAVWIDTAYQSVPDDSTVLALRPGQSAHIGWVPNDAEPATGGGWFGPLWRQITTELSFLLFVPGDYQISVQTKYWTDPARPPLEYHSLTTTMTVGVVTPQFVILFGAALGGLIAYIIFPNRRTREVIEDEVSLRGHRVRRSWRTLTRVQKRVGAALLAMLWSAIVTVLISRLGETQFLVSVTVADFWGAIAIGLVAQYAGSKWFERLFPAPEGSAPTTASGGSAPAPQEPADLPLRPDPVDSPIPVDGYPGASPREPTPEAPRA